MRTFKKIIYCLICYPIILPIFVIVSMLYNGFEYINDQLVKLVGHLKDILLEYDYTSKEAFELFAKMYNNHIDASELSDSQLERYITICNNARLEAEEELDARK